MELHDEDPQQIRKFRGIVIRLEKILEPLGQLDEEALQKIDGIGKSVAAYISEIKQTQTLSLVTELAEKTPAGLIDLLRLNGFGPKKIRTLWQELNITRLEQLLQACYDNKVKDLPGFGLKSQQQLIKSGEFLKNNQNKLLWADTQPLAEQLLEILQETFPSLLISLTGEYRRKCEIVSQLELVVGDDNFQSVYQFLDTLSFLEKTPRRSGPFTWAGHFSQVHLPLLVRFCYARQFIKKQFKFTGSPLHMKKVVKDQQNFLQLLDGFEPESEAEIYQQASMPYVIPELREGLLEFKYADSEKLSAPRLEMKHLKGVLHAHSHYSDGKVRLADLARYCRDQGYQYLGITDHSRSSVIANGMEVYRIRQQHEEIERLNQEIAPFRILKGIECDILSDGKLDYEEEVLKTFDFIVISVHNNLNMTREQATNRIIRAIENPYTTILGHPTGRLLLQREGYPIDHQAVIDACAQNQVVIEINANPRRLDLDWRWLDYAREKQVMISINPDAHAIKSVSDIQYGVYIANKGLLEPENILNCLNLDQLIDYFDQKKVHIK